MLRFGKTKVAKEEFSGAKKPMKTWDANVGNIVTSKLTESKNNPKDLIKCFDEVIRLLVLILPKMSGYVKTSKDKGEDKNKNNKLMSLHIDDNKLLGKYETIWTKIEDIKHIELDALKVYYDIYIYIYIYIYKPK